MHILGKISANFPVLARFLFITSEAELDYYHQKVNAPLASGVAEQLIALDLSKLRISK